MTTRILFVIDSLDHRGTATQLSLLARGLPRDRFEPSVCAISRGGVHEENLRAADVDASVLSRRWPADARVYLRLKRLLRSTRPDIVHTWSPTGHRYGRLAAKGNSHRVVISTKQSLEHRTSSATSTLDRHLSQSTDCVVATSETVLDECRDRRTAGQRSEIIRSGVEHLDASPRNERQKLLDELRLPKDTKFVLAVDRFNPQRRLKDLIWAADLVKCVRDDVHVLIVGEGDQRWRLEKFRDQVEIRDRVHLLGTRDDVRNIMAACNVFWSAGNNLGAPNALLEAMATGLPVVASDVPAHREVITPKATGLLIPLGDRAGYARNTLTLLEHTDFARDLGEAGRQHVIREFDAQSMINRYVELYEELLR